MRKLLVTSMLLLSLVGCDEVKKGPETGETNSSPPSEHQLDEKMSETNSNDADDKRFSYLEQLSAAKQEAFAEFITERNLEYLYDFTPEDMVIAYLYCLSVGDPYLIYAITYNAGTLPDPETYRTEYFEYAANHDSETAVHYRYFDSIEIDEKTAEENKVTVLVTAGVGIMTHSLALGLQKENKVWKVDTYHALTHYKEKASEIR